MNSRDFVYWAQGFFELTLAGVADKDRGKPLELNAAQTDCFRRHLAMVFKHEIDPSHGDAEHQAALSALHQGGGLLADSPKPPQGVMYRC